MALKRVFEGQNILVIEIEDNNKQDLQELDALMQGNYHVIGLVKNDEVVKTLNFKPLGKKTLRVFIEKGGLKQA